VYRAHDGEVTSVSFAPGDMKFVSSSDDQAIKIWDFSRQQEEGALSGHTWSVGGRASEPLLRAVLRGA
jgi:polyadenylation factor subunit 2